MAEQNHGLQAAAPPLLPAETEAPPERKNLLTLIREWPLSRKLATAAVLLISLALFGILIFQARTADQQLLYANLELNDAAAITEWLKGQKIDYTLKNGGRDIWIAAPLIYQTRLGLAANSLPSGGGVGFEIFDKQSFALTDYAQKVNYTRALQGELARTISSLAPVESTRVHLALPEKRLFKNQQAPTTASVIVTLVPGKTLDRKQVQGIIHLVAASVNDLDPKNVKVIDSNGMELESEKPTDEDKLLSADMLAFQREVEKRLALQAQDLLDKSMGKDKAMVRVSANLDFAKIEKTEEHFDGDDPVVRSEQVNQESNGTETTGGIPGVQSNLQGSQPAQNASSPPSSKNSRTTNYEISKTISKVVNPVGTINKLSVSVLVADKLAPGENGKPGTPVPRTPEELKSIENMVASAIGVMPKRGDVINVLSMPFVDEGDIRQEGGDQSKDNKFYQYLPFIKYGLILLGILLVYFFFIRPVIKTMRGEVQQHYKTVQQLEQEQEQLVQLPEEPLEPPPPVDEAIVHLRREIQQNQIPTAFIVKNWIQEG